MFSSWEASFAELMRAARSLSRVRSAASGSSSSSALSRCFCIVIRFEKKPVIGEKRVLRSLTPIVLRSVLGSLLGCAPPFGEAPACVWGSVAAGVDSTVVVMIVAFGFGTGGGQTGASWTSASMEEAAVPVASVISVVASTSGRASKKMADAKS